MRLHIKHMVSLRERKIVEEELDKLSLVFLPAEQGEIELTGAILDEDILRIKTALAVHGLELLEDKKSQLIEKIKTSIIEMVNDAEKPLRTNFSNYLSSRLMYDYTYMANLFSKVQGITIEHYIMFHKIERVKELLSLGQLTLTEISYKLHYSSVAHLSSQFKKVTGFTPSYFKQSGNKGWLTADNV
ncbi:helix-turn-helix domain-containing protein [Dyadobacter psychrotolerans]|uniref:AraC family transcriptional regulator n=1 Tax=Dyadobacter psychrotolerans TaxID=2541721 RepID=A0A4R5DEK4_9BACT|nr:AraC family transcriptional regulator [Dyadobacter psychrotolerans]TDE11547.1 AraC family transcriptional regulator [Dyadobacter psychrotolerans]